MLLEVAHGLVEHEIDVDIVLVRSGGALRDSVPRPCPCRSTCTSSGRCSQAVGSVATWPANALTVVISGAHADQRRECRRDQARSAPHSDHRDPTQHDCGALDDESRPRAASWRRVGRSRTRIGSSQYPRVSPPTSSTPSACDAEKISVIHNPVISSRLFADAEAALEHPWLADKVGRVLLAVGRLTAQKDFATLFRAVALLPSDHRLVLLGEGELRDELVELAEHLGIQRARRPARLHGQPVSVVRERRCRRAVVAVRGAANRSHRGAPLHVRDRVNRLPEWPARDSRRKADGAASCRAANRLHSPTRSTRRSARIVRGRMTHGCDTK